MPQAEKQVKIRLALEAVAAAENIEASEDELNAEVKRCLLYTSDYKGCFLREIAGSAGGKRQKTALGRCRTTRPSDGPAGKKER